MRDEGPTEDELRDAKTYLIGSFPLSLDSTRRIAGVLVRMQLDGLGIDYLDRRAALISGGHAGSGPRVARRLYDPGAAQLCRRRRPGRFAADPPDPRGTGLKPRREPIERARRRAEGVAGAGRLIAFAQ